VSKAIFFRIILVLALVLFLIVTAGCGEKAADQVQEQYDKTIGETNRVSVDANLTSINVSIRMYSSNNADSPSIDDLLDSGLVMSWPAGPDGVSYELVEKDGKTVAVANRNNAGAWWTAAENQVAYPVEW